jgi:hypothetical protein
VLNRVGRNCCGSRWGVGRIGRWAVRVQVLRLTVFNGYRRRAWTSRVVSIDVLTDWASNEIVACWVADADDLVLDALTILCGLRGKIASCRRRRGWPLVIVSRRATLAVMRLSSRSPGGYGASTTGTCWLSPLSPMLNHRIKAVVVGGCLVLRTVKVSLGLGISY